MYKNLLKRLLTVAVPSVFISACSVMPPADFPREDFVDVDKFMGAWYVIAVIPPSFLDNTYNEIERYRRVSDRKIETVFTYRNGGFDEKLKKWEPTGYVVPESNGAVWGMSFIWPIQQEYTISYVNDDYTQTIVARSKRDMVWIMARTPHIPDSDYQSMVARVKDLGYDMSKLRKIPQQKLSERDDLIPK